uniref:Uncharacterized protein n=1 Tax=Lepeophtheirus salmonis TaxID=72036 RepID=A0A0K2U9K8_LEPSM
MASNLFKTEFKTLWSGGGASSRDFKYERIFNVVETLLIFPPVAKCLTILLSSLFPLYPIENVRSDFITRLNNTSGTSKSSL